MHAYIFICIISSFPACYVYISMKLGMTKIYIDSRFGAENSKSETDLSIELPRSFNVPDGVVAQIDDLGIPVSWARLMKETKTAMLNLPAAEP